MDVIDNRKRERVILDSLAQDDQEFLYARLDTKSGIIYFHGTELGKRFLIKRLEFLTHFWRYCTGTPLTMQTSEEEIPLAIDGAEVMAVGEDMEVSKEDIGRLLGASQHQEIPFSNGDLKVRVINVSQMDNSSYAKSEPQIKMEQSDDLIIQDKATDRATKYPRFGDVEIANSAPDDVLAKKDGLSTQVTIATGDKEMTVLDDVSDVCEKNLGSQFLTMADSQVMSSYYGINHEDATILLKENSKRKCSSTLNDGKPDSTAGDGSIIERDETMPCTTVINDSLHDNNCNLIPNTGSYLVHKESNTGRHMVHREPNTGSHMVYKEPKTGSHMVHKEPNTGSHMVHREPKTGSHMVHREPNTGSHMIHKEPNTGSNMVHREPNIGSHMVHKEQNTESHMVHKEPNTGNHMIHKEPNTGSNMVHREPKIGSHMVHREPKIGSHMVHREPNTGSHMVHREPNTEIHMVHRQPNTGSHMVHKEPNTGSHMVHREPKTGSNIEGGVSIEGDRILDLDMEENGNDETTYQKMTCNNKDEIEEINAKNIKEVEIQQTKEQETANHYYESFMVCLSPNDTRPQLFSCKVCGRIYQLKKCLVNHIQNHIIDGEINIDDENSIQKISYAENDSFEGENTVNEEDMDIVQTTEQERTDNDGESNMVHVTSYDEAVSDEDDTTDEGSEDKKDQVSKDTHLRPSKSTINRGRKSKSEPQIFECKLCGRIYQLKKCLETHIQNHVIDGEMNVNDEIYQALICAKKDGFEGENAIKVRDAENYQTREQEVTDDHGQSSMAITPSNGNDIMSDEDDDDNDEGSENNEDIDSDDEYLPPSKLKTCKQERSISTRPHFLECKICGRVYKLRKCYEKHIQTHIAEGDMNVNVEEPSCQERTGPKKDSLEGENVIKINDTDIQQIRDPETAFDNGELFIVDLASYDYNAESGKDGYIDKIHENNENVIPNNEYEPPSESTSCKLKNKSKLREPQLFNCPKCGRIFKRKKRLENHIKNHPGDPDPDQKFQCDLCGKIYRLENSLRTHIKARHKDRLFQCEVCGKMFAESRQVNVHCKKVHRGIAPYECNICHEKFSWHNTYKAHVKRHCETAEPRHPCSVCGKTYTTKDILNRHMKIHQNDMKFKCPYCKRHFVQSYALTRHLRFHTGEKPYKCQICGEGFAHNVTLKYHVSKAH